MIGTRCIPGIRFAFRYQTERVSAISKNFLSRALVLVLLSVSVSGQALANVATYHNDNYRTGWNESETKLTPATVASPNFHRLFSIVVDAQIDAQPLYVSAVSIAGASHAVVYTATEKNTVYAIDADTGKILLSRNLGTPIPLSSLPGGCPNGDNTVGITATPVIDQKAGILYVIAYRLISNKPTYTLFALNIATLGNALKPATVAATAHLKNGAIYDFNAAVSRLRAALLLNGGNLYAGFTSFCDNLPSQTRGWVIGWNSSTLAPLQSARLTNILATSPKSYFLSTVWMSGYGIAADLTGSLFFVTGNSDPASTALYPSNLGESVIKLTSDLSRVSSFFTPSTASTGSNALDQKDDDFGAGGALLIPPQPGKYPYLVVAAGKVGQMYLLDRQKLGGYGHGTDNVLGTYDIGQCFCGQSFYKGSDGIGRIVSSGGNQVRIWKIVTSDTVAPTLLQESISPVIATGQDHGFFTSVTSSTTHAKTAVIWVLSRPVSAQDDSVNLYAIDPSAIDGSGQSKILAKVAAGQWPKVNGNANLVPTVADGRVFVGSYQRLNIFGLAAGAKATGAPIVAAETAPEPEATQQPDAERAIYGVLVSAAGDTLVLATRVGAHITIKSTDALAAGTAAVPVVGRAYLARGTIGSDGKLRATSVQRVKQSPGLWEPDH
jgi:hypothetical protein